jgi:hypothetical protein
MAGRNVDNQVADAALGHGLQVITDRVHVHAIDKWCPQFQHMPGLQHELM